MDLTLFHPPNPEGLRRDFYMKDKFNGWTKLRSCRFLEWTGWYNYSLAQRLLGHYRLFQHFKARYHNQEWEFSAVKAYIVYYLTTHDRKFSFFKKLRWFHALGSPKDYYPVTQVAAVNQILLKEGSGILQEFLESAETDFAAAFTKAIQQINDPAFLDGKALKLMNLSISQNNQFNTNRSIAYHPLIIQQPLKIGAKGKEPGVFSKRQLLIFFDLLSELGKMEKIDLRKKNKHASLAALLHAITGKSQESIQDELKDYCHKGLYECRTDGEIEQLIIVLTNLAAPFRDAGFNAFAKLADQKIDWLRQQKKK